MVNKLIERLDQWLQAHRPIYYQELLPGLTDSEYEKFEERLGLRAPAAFRALYQWRNGQSAKCYKGFQDNRQFASAECILGSKQILDEMNEGNEEGGFDSGFAMANWWSPSWIPFLDNGGGDHLCLDLGGAFTGRPGQLITFWHDWENRSIEYPSLELWLEIFVGSLEAGLWADVKGDLHPVNEKAWDNYRSRHNPGYPLRYEAGDGAQS
jgi:cell wall assembly regulator SMI1